MAREGRGGGWWPEGEGEPNDRDGEPKGDAPDGGNERGPAPRTERPRGLASGGRSNPPSRYSLFVGLAFVALIVVALFNLLGNDDAGILGAGSGEEGEPLVEFAVVDATGTTDGDANIAQDDCESSLNPCPADQQRSPACEIEAADAIRVCDFFDLPLAISFWFTRGGDCTPTQDAFDQVASRYDDRVNFLSVNVRDDREIVTGLIDERGWSVPVGLDSDGAVSNLYRVGVCPTIVLAYPGGILYDARAGAVDIAGIEGLVEELLDASRLREETSR